MTPQTRGVVVVQLLSHVHCEVPPPAFALETPRVQASFCALILLPTPAFPGGNSGKEPSCQCRRCKRHRLDPRVRKIPWRRAWQPTPVFFHGQRSLAGWSCRVRHDWETNTFTFFLFHLSTWCWLWRLLIHEPSLVPRRIGPSLTISPPDSEGTADSQRQCKAVARRTGGQ